ncbi:MAG: electron transfer flavoprotein subunit alpha/FixB family protein, partial [Candidatus Binataceae bacterium]
SVRAVELGAPDDFGFKGSPTWVKEVQFLSTPKTECHFIDAADPERAAAEVVGALEKLDALAPRQRKRRAASEQVRPAVRGRDVWVVCEENLQGDVTRATLELLSSGDELAGAVGGALVAVMISKSQQRHAGLLASYGADRLLVLNGAALDSYTPEGWAAALASVVPEREPWALLLSASERGRDFGPRLAARLNLGLTGDAIGLEVDAQRRLVALKPAFGGNIVAPILSKTFPQAATVRAGVLELAEACEKRPAEVEVVSIDGASIKSRLVRAHSLLDSSMAQLEGAEVVVGIGMGVGGPDGVARVRDFARSIGAAMCATRRVTDAGWMPRQLQVGLTGKAIDPRLYFAIGVRGAPNHTVGIKRAQTVVAINNDPESPIFERANLGAVADWSAIVAPLEAALRAVRS